jgi:hypothetical protein
MIVQHRAILDASDRRQPWAENCAAIAFSRNGKTLSDTRCLDTVFVKGKRLKMAQIANNAILKMMGK